jgi:Polysaccharide lyase
VPKAKEAKKMRRFIFSVTLLALGFAAGLITAQSSVFDWLGVRPEESMQVQPPTAPLAFSDTFDRKADDFIPPWSRLDRAAPDRITTSSTHTRKGTHSAKLTVLDSDNPNGWGTRADLTAGNMFCEGDDYYVGYSLLLPSNFLGQLSSDGWLMVAEDGYSGHSRPPFAYYFIGRPSGGKFELLATPDGHISGNPILSVDPTYGKWMDIVTYYKFSADSSVGFIEVWINGEQQTFTTGQERYRQNTLEPGSPVCGQVMHNSYRSAGMADSVTIYQDEIKVGQSYSAVAP